jgi:WD40 repeat protein
VVLTLPGYEGMDLQAPAVSPDSRRVAVPGDVLHIYDLATGEELLALEGLPAPVFAAAFGPDGMQVATGGPDGRLRVWDAATGEELWNQVAVTRWWEEEEGVAGEEERKAGPPLRPRPAATPSWPQGGGGAFGPR